MHRSFASLWLALTVVPLVPVLAVAQITVASQQLTLTHEQVVVSYNTSVGNSGSCQDFNFYCLRPSATIRVSPCPPGLPCVGGTHTFTLGQGGFSAVLSLELGTSYSFTGTWKREYGYVNTFPCTYSCSSTGNLAPKNYDTPTSPYWQVTPVSETGTTLVVDLELKNFVTLLCPGAACAMREQNLTVEPCALDINGWGPSCSERLPYPDNTFRVTLAKGQTYTFGGTAGLMGFRPEQGGACVEPSCNWVGNIVPLEYGGAVATTPTTWGKVKSLYR